jgi:transcriptional regulator with XRE-family HTH domain
MGNRIREIREALRREHPERYGQAAVALRVGVDVSTLRRWESGKSVPTRHHARVLARALGVTVEQLGFRQTEDPSAG